MTKSLSPSFSSESSIVTTFFNQNKYLSTLDDTRLEKKKNFEHIYVTKTRTLVTSDSAFRVVNLCVSPLPTSKKKKNHKPHSHERNVERRSFCRKYRGYDRACFSAKSSPPRTVSIRHRTKGERYPPPARRIFYDNSGRRFELEKNRKEVEGYEFVRL